MKMMKKISKTKRKMQNGGDESKPPYVKTVGPKGGTMTADTSGLAGGAKRFKVTGKGPSGRTVEFETNRRGAKKMVEASKTPGKKQTKVRVMGGMKANPPYPKESPLDGVFKKGGSFPDLNKDGKITKADILKGRGVIAKKGMKVKKKMQYGGAAASMKPTMKSGGKMTKKCMYGCK
jgi:hypothetical protein